MVESYVANVVVAGSNPVSRSIYLDRGLHIGYNINICICRRVT